MANQPLAGLTVGVTADRRWEEQAELLRRRGATVLHGPSLRTLPLGTDHELREATEAVLAARPDVFVFSTGLGVRGWAEAAEAVGLGDELTEVIEQADVVARGPKAAGAALTAGWPVHWRAPTATSAEVVAHLAEVGIAGRTVAAQLDGRREPVLADQLRDLGAEVIAVPVYRWERPLEVAPVLRLIEQAAAGRLDAVSFTSSPAVWNVREIAAEHGLLDDLLSAFGSGLLALCIGPVCAATAVDCGFGAPLQPVRHRLGAMVQTWVTTVRAERLWHDVDGLEVALAASTVTVGDTVVELAPRERDVLDVLLRRPGVVVSKDELSRRVWGGDADGHAVEVTVGRLRRRVAAVLDIGTVARRGYRVAANAHSRSGTV